MSRDTVALMTFGQVQVRRKVLLRDWNMQLLRLQLFQDELTGWRKHFPALRLMDLLSEDAQGGNRSEEAKSKPHWLCISLCQSDSTTFIETLYHAKLESFSRVKSSGETSSQLKWEEVFLPVNNTDHCTYMIVCFINIKPPFIIQINLSPLLE